MDKVNLTTKPTQLSVKQWRIALNLEDQFVQNIRINKSVFDKFVSKTDKEFHIRYCLALQNTWCRYVFTPDHRSQSAYKSSDRFETQ